MHRYASDPVTDRSLRHSVRDGIAYSVMSGGGETYFSAFAVFLRASTTQIGWLASLPPLLGSFAQILSVMLGRLLRRRKSIILMGACLQALVWLPLIVLPLLYREHAVTILIVCVTLYYAFANLAAPQWNSLMGDLVPEKRRGRFFARRTVMASTTAFIALVLSGLILNLFDTLALTFSGFALVFAVSAIARGISVYHLVRMEDPPGQVATMDLVTDHGFWQRARHSPFVRFSLFFALMQSAVAIAAPFFTVYMLRDLHYSYLQFMVNTAASVILQVLTLNIWGRVGDQFGNRKILVLTGAVIPVIPALWLLSNHYVYLLVLQALGGLVWAGFSLSAGNFFYDLVPPAKRAGYMAMHNLLASVGIFAGALLGGYLGAVLPLQWSWGNDHLEWSSALFGVFLFSAIARAMVVLVFLPRLKEVRQVRPVSVGGLVFRVVRYNALAGLFFDIVGRSRSRVKPETRDVATGKSQ